MPDAGCTRPTGNVPQRLPLPTYTARPGSALKMACFTWAAMSADFSFSPTALHSLGRWLQQCGYRFTTPTPATHARVLARCPQALAQDVRGIFGWNLPFADAAADRLLPPELPGLLQGAGLLKRTGASASHWRSTVRFGTLGGLLLAHSAFPTDSADTVFFGPDTYRFAALIERTLAQVPLPAGARVLDMGCGGGAGGLVAAGPAHGAQADSAALAALVLADINPRALAFAQVNAALAGVAAPLHCVQSDLFAQVDGLFDLVVSNPPYLVDGAERTYRHGGGALGGDLSERIARASLARLRPGGRLVLYTGSVIVDGHDALGKALQAAVAAHGNWPMQYSELDPDVFGEELELPFYAAARAERIAAVALVVQRPQA